MFKAAIEFLEWNALVRMELVKSGSSYIEDILVYLFMFEVS